MGRLAKTGAACSNKEEGRSSPFQDYKYEG